ncbi:chemotaxis protein CheW [Pseudooceanicola sp. LIPI14-2-Ac024]|uniref:chemotaxis protein CheW n=1 Tax=Pseudooceanicola sp. LIPI14-2-Ac024 TaxID=3344875 RepID=UPI0035CFC2F9
MESVGTVVTCSVAGSLFAVEVKPVREIMSSRPAARLPNAPAHLLGLIDVRGASVALVDLRRILGEPWRDDDEDTRIILLTIDGGRRSHLVALRVDRVIEVTELDGGGRIAPLDEAEMLDWDPRLVCGIGRRDDAIVTLLEVGAIFDPAVMEAARRRSAPAANLPCAS